MTRDVLIVSQVELTGVQDTATELVYTWPIRKHTDHHTIWKWM